MQLRRGFVETDAFVVAGTILVVTLLIAFVRNEMSVRAARAKCAAKPKSIHHETFIDSYQVWRCASAEQDPKDSGQLVIELAPVDPDLGREVGRFRFTREHPQFDFLLKAEDKLIRIEVAPLDKPVAGCEGRASFMIFHEIIQPTPSQRRGSSFFRPDLYRLQSK